MTDQVRRVVTGHDRRNRSVFADDSTVEAIRPLLLGGAAIHWLWGVDSLPDLPGAAGPPVANTTFYPPPGGFRFGLLTLPPPGQAAPRPGPGEAADAVAEIEAALPGLLAHLDRDDPGMHRSATVDAVVVLSGQVTLELDDGATRELAAGDVVIQNGTRHRWANAGTGAATIAFFLCGVRHALVEADGDR